MVIIMLDDSENEKDLKKRRIIKRALIIACALLLIGACLFWLFKDSFSFYTLRYTVTSQTTPASPETSPNEDDLPIDPETDNDDLPEAAADAEPPETPIGLRRALPGIGGTFEVSDTTVYRFVPDSSGVWEFVTSANGRFDPVLTIMDSEYNEIAYSDDHGGSLNSYVSLELDEGETYFVYAEFHGPIGSYKLSVSYGVGSGGGIAADEVLPSGGTVIISKAKNFKFNTDVGGVWIFTTKDGGNSDPVLYLYDRFGNEIAYDDDSSGNKNAKLVALLEAEETYVLRAGFYAGGSGTYTISITAPMEFPESGGEARISGEGSYSFTPDHSAIWEFETTSIGINDPEIYIFDSNFDLLAYDDDGRGGNDAFLSLELNEAEQYYIYVNMHNTNGSTVLTVAEGR